MPEKLYLQMKELAVKDGRSVSGEIRQILIGYTEYLERGGVSWCEDWKNRGKEVYIQT